MDISRRSLLATLGASSLLVLAPRGAIAARGRKFAFSLDKVPALKKVGGSAVVKVRTWKVLLLRVSAKRVLAFDAHCTHQRCLVEYNPGKKRIDCGCHASKFALDGRPLGGPAKRPLPAYRTWLRGDRLIVQVR